MFWIEKCYDLIPLSMGSIDKGTIDNNQQQVRWRLLTGHKSLSEQMLAQIIAAYIQASLGLDELTGQVE